MSIRIVIEGGSAFDRQFLERGYALNRTTPAAVTAAGGVPYFAAEPALAAEYAAFGDALILTGSYSYAPKEELRRSLVQDGEEGRRAFSEDLYRRFTDLGKPVLGICLGFQTINEILGGTVVNDFKLTDGVEHLMYPHEVEAKEGTVLAKLFGRRFLVNSRHNRKVEVLAKELVATAWSPDGVIEAFEHKRLPVYGVEWHPERMRGDWKDPWNAEDETPLFRALVELAARRKEEGR